MRHKKRPAGGAGQRMYADWIVIMNLQWIHLDVIYLRFFKLIDSLIRKHRLMYISYIDRS